MKPPNPSIKLDAALTRPTSYVNVRRHNYLQECVNDKKASES